MIEQIIRVRWVLKPKSLTEFVHFNNIVNILKGLTTTKYII